MNGTELASVGGPSGTCRTAALELPAGGQLVHAVGPQGAGSAKVHLVQIG